MQVHVYALCWNEERMLPYFFRHYEQVADRFIIYDNHSSDSSPDLLRAHGKVTLKTFSVEGESFVDAARRMYDSIWMESRGSADWVIVCNVDEHYYHPDLRHYLQECRAAGSTVVPALAYEMVSDTFPDGPGRLCDQVRVGARAPYMDKTGIFNPDAVESIDYGVGRHYARPVGRIACAPAGDVKLLHFKYLGLPYLRARYAELGARLRRLDRENRWGYQYFWNESELSESFARTRESAHNIIEVDSEGNGRRQGGN